MNEILDTSSNTRYLIEGILGRGSFGICYKIKNVTTGSIFACKKIVSMKKEMFIEDLQEIQIQYELKHRHIVSLHSAFKYKFGIYMVMELCQKQSLRELLKRRKTLTIPEVCYYMHQILQACAYMHENNVIHRDLKLENILLNHNLEIKIADFGLAVHILNDEERRKTFLGTAPYLAPEILRFVGYGCEVDIWSAGCIMYCLIVGSLPFKLGDRIMFQKIEKHDYFLPPGIHVSARALLKKLLHPKPFHRSTAEEALKHDFFTKGFLPSCLPASSFTMIPRFNNTVLKKLN